MDNDKLIDQLSRDALEGLHAATVATAQAGDQQSESYIVASQDSIRTLNRVLQHAVALFLEERGEYPDETYHERIHQLRRSRACPLEQSDINALFENNQLRNELEHSLPPSVELWQVQRVAAKVHKALPLLVPGIDWIASLKDSWEEYRRQFGVARREASSGHNLPRPDYTRFVGREREIAELQDSLEHPRHWIVSVDGIGGVGKSALAMEIAWRMADQMRLGISPWKHIVWVSAKSDRLLPSATGVENITPGFRVLEEVLDQILLVAGFPEYVEKGIQSKREAVTHILEMDPVLLFVDNYETVEDPSVLEFLDNLPGADLRPIGHKVILTTRHRETFGKQIRLEGLAEWEAEKLIQQTAEEFNVIEYLEDSAIRKRIAIETGRIPLALRWVVGQVSLGRSIGDVLTKMKQRTEEIHRFCFDATIAELDEAHLKTLYVLSQLSDPAEIETIAAVADYSREDIDSYIGTLLRYSLVNRILETVWEIDLYQLLPLTATYCAGLGSRWPSYASEVAKRAGVEDKRQRTVAVANGIYKRYGAFNQDQRVAVAAATAARDEYGQGNTEKALKMLDDAKALSPDLGYVYLVEAEILKREEKFTDARRSLEQAYELEPQNAEISRTWGELEHSLGKHEKAMEMFERACALKPDDVGLRLALAQATIEEAKQCLLRSRKRRAGQLFRDALRHARAALVEPVQSVVQKRHNVDCYEVMIEIYQKQGKADEALRVCSEALDVDPDSFYLRSVLNSLESDSSGKE